MTPRVRGVAHGSDVFLRVLGIILRKIGIRKCWITDADSQMLSWMFAPRRYLPMGSSEVRVIVVEGLAVFLFNSHKNMMCSNIVC